MDGYNEEIKRKVLGYRYISFYIFVEYWSMIYMNSMTLNLEQGLALRG